MTRLLLLAATFALLPISASAQGFLPVGEDDNCMGCPPTMSADLSNEADQVSKIGETMKDYSDDDPGYGFIWWLATNFSPHIPVDPKCPPPDGCTDDDPPTDNPPTGDPPSEDPPSGDPPTEDPPSEDPPTDGGESTQKSSSRSSSPPTGGSDPPSDPETFDAGDRAAALAVRDRFETLAEGSFVPGAALANGARVRLVSKREATADRGEYVMRFEIVPRGPRARPVPVLVQAIGGKLYVRTARRVSEAPGVRLRSDRPQRRSIRG